VLHSVSYSLISQLEGADFAAVAGVVLGEAVVAASAGPGSGWVPATDRVLGAGHYFGLLRCP